MAFGFKPPMLNEPLLESSSPYALSVTVLSALLWFCASLFEAYTVQVVPPNAAWVEASTLSQAIAAHCVEYEPFHGRLWRSWSISRAEAEWLRS